METVFMEGVELLSQSEIMNHHVGLIMILLLGGFVLGAIGIGTFDVADNTMSLIMVIVAAGCFIGIFVVMMNSTPTGEYQYKVTISDEVNFNEFDERYKVVSQDGKIYTIEERK